MSRVVRQGLCSFAVLISWPCHNSHTPGSATPDNRVRGMNDTNILLVLVWTAGASMREDCLLNHHITMEIGLCQISLPPCGLSFSDVLGEKKNKVYVVSNVPEKNNIACKFCESSGFFCFLTGIPDSA